MNKQFSNINSAFSNNSPQSIHPSFKNQNNTLYPNLNDNLLKEALVEYRLNIDSIDRDIIQFPDPFSYIVNFGPVANSGVDSTIKRSSLKNELKRINRKSGSSSLNNVNEDLFDDDDKFILNYENNLKRVFNPYITRDFKNIKFIRLDNIILPRFNKVIINKDWKFDSSCDKSNSYIKDDFERVKDLVILNNRYIPDLNTTNSLFLDRFIQISIKELANNKNLATNQINTNTFTVLPDKHLGLLYWRGNPYYAVNIFKDSLLGNLNKLTFEFYDSFGNQIKLDTSNINFETSFISSTQLLNTSNININDIYDNNDFMAYIKNKLISILKALIIINKNLNNKLDIFNNISFNTDVFDVSEHDFYSFVNSSGFINSVKCNKTLNRTVMISIDDFINNTIFTCNSNHNIICLYNNYLQFGHNVLVSLKNEISNLPLNKFFQNHIMFVMGVSENELNTQVKYN